MFSGVKKGALGTNGLSIMSTRKIGVNANESYIIIDYDRFCHWSILSRYSKKVLEKNVYSFSIWIIVKKHIKQIAVLMLLW